MQIRTYEKNLDKIEVLLIQSMRGFHLLYDNKAIAKVLQTPTERINFFSRDNMKRIQDLFSGLIEKETLQEKKDFINGLNRKDYEILLRTYFHILDSTLLTATELKH